ncbi:exodeoxyribonuclease VII small subunit [Acidihalobacter aeolianus]|uniref:Exodeoxyribonuclease 7 small subunit n=1 Tax=Acidihalobacter aeolianus TaxID=2792603 RepID=A0A1D8K9A2_9GAMM|nr:exodeoxyribonuclease VII small subunit [Acidihalobacter aeolianus]AOV17511.1 exodeoxyribonuclease VII small subunit [Acidihalobacter aeolianus]
MSPKSKKIDFEKTLAELEALVERMEQGELSLEDSLKEFERGIALTRGCQQALADAELRVRQLSADGSESVPNGLGQDEGKPDDAQ